MYHYDDEPTRRWKTIAAVVAVVLLGAAFAFWQLRSDSGSGPGEPDTVADAEVDTSIVSVTTTDATTIARTGPTSTTPTATTVPSSGAPGTTEATSSTSGVPATSVASLPPAPGNSPLGYPTGPDGLPLPMVVIFDTDTITISGQVPSQAAQERIAALAKANSQFPDAEVVDNLVINPAVPISVGVRVIELNSARFPEGIAEILPDHALELDRVVAIMQALPNISVVVVGHADQRGDDIGNFAISDERARAVVNYLLYLGISPTRLSSRAAGETDLLTVGDDDAALALNRRTEFIFSGLLIE